MDGQAPASVEFFITCNPPLSPRGVDDVFKKVFDVFQRPFEDLDVFYDAELPAIKVITRPELEESVRELIRGCIDDILSEELHVYGNKLQTNIDLLGDDPEMSLADAKLVPWPEWKTHGSQNISAYEKQRYPHTMAQYDYKHIWRGLEECEGWVLSDLFEYVSNPIWHGSGVPSLIEDFEAIFDSVVDWSKDQKTIYLGTNCLAGNSRLQQCAGMLESFLELGLYNSAGSRAGPSVATSFSTVRHLVMASSNTRAAFRRFSNVGFGLITHSHPLRRRAYSRTEILRATTMRTTTRAVDHRFNVDTTTYPLKDRQRKDLNAVWTAFADYDWAALDTGHRRLDTAEDLLSSVESPQTVPNLFVSSAMSIQNETNALGNFSPIMDLLDAPISSIAGTLQTALEPSTVKHIPAPVPDDEVEELRVCWDRLSLSETDTASAALILTAEFTKPSSISSLGDPSCFMGENVDDSDIVSHLPFLEAFRTECLRLSQILRHTPGPTRMSVTFGRICLFNFPAGDLYGSPSAKALFIDDLQDRLNRDYPRLQPEQHDSSKIDFSSVLSTCGADASLIALVQPHGRQGWKEPNRRVFYDFICHAGTQAQDDIVMTIDAATLEAEIRGPTKELATVMVHCPRSAWDFKISATHSAPSSELASCVQAANDLAASLKVSVGANNEVTLQVDVKEHMDLYVEKVLVRQVAEYDSNDCDSSILIVTMTRRLSVRRQDNHQTKGEKSARVTAKMDQVQHNRLEPNQWVEAEIESRRGRQILRENLQLEPGQTSRWDHDQLVAEKVLDQLCWPAMGMMVSNNTDSTHNLDHVGMHNCNGLGRVKETATNRAEETAHIAPRAKAKGPREAFFW